MSSLAICLIYDFQLEYLLPLTYRHLRRALSDFAKAKQEAIQHIQDYDTTSCAFVGNRILHYTRIYEFQPRATLFLMRL